MNTSTDTLTADPDAHLAGTPWDTWRHRVAVLWDCTPLTVSAHPDAYAAFNSKVHPADFARWRLE